MGLAVVADFAEEDFAFADAGFAADVGFAADADFAGAAFVADLVALLAIRVSKGLRKGRNASSDFMKHEASHGLDPHLHQIWMA